MHCHELVTTAACDVFDVLSSEQYSVARGRIVAGILSTDMKCHGLRIVRNQSETRDTKYLVTTHGYVVTMGGGMTKG
eukprot:5546769-Amphidinium_carterae.1